jgi:NADPH-dependent ferric siderophore reductase
MLRITFASPDLADFSSPSPDDHIKLFLPDPANAGQQVMRDYTPRAFDAARKTLTIDFAVHDAGPATTWAFDAKPGGQADYRRTQRFGGGRRRLRLLPADRR